MNRVVVPYKQNIAVITRGYLFKVYILSAFPTYLYSQRTQGSYVLLCTPTIIIIIII